MIKQLRLLLTLLVLSVVGGAFAQTTIADYPTSTTNIGLRGGITASTVKINSNKNSVAGIKLDGSYTSKGKLAKWVSVKFEGGLKSGDVVSVAGAVSVAAKDTASKSGSIDLFTWNGSKATVLNNFTCVNGRLSTDNPVVQTFTLTTDADSICFGRNGNTSTFITTLKVIRPGAVAPVFELTADKIGLNESSQIVVKGKTDLDGLTLSNITYGTEGIVTVDATGKVTPVAKGTTSISFGTDAIAERYLASTGNKFNITVTAEQAAAPTISPADGTIFTTESQEVTITNNQEGADVYYTLDGTDPTASSNKYSAPFEISETSTVKTIAIKEGMENSDIVSATFTKKILLNQVDVTEATTWDFSKASSQKEIKLDDTTTPKKNEWVVYANVDGINNDASFNSQALNVSGEYMIRDGKYFQGGYVKFNTTVAGTVEVVFSNTGNRSAEGDNRYLNINGTNTTAKSLVSSTTVTGSANVPAGEVTIKGTLQSDGSDQYIRIYKITFTPQTAESATIGAAGWATYVTKGDVDFSNDANVTAYTAKIGQDEITLTPVTAAPANSPLVIKGNAGTYELTAAATTPAALDNDLVAATSDVTADGSQYILAVLSDGSVGFAQATTGTIAAGKAYLKVNSASAKSFIAIGIGETTGINNVVAPTTLNENAPMYNLAGQRVTKAYKGVVIQNGKKFLMNK